MYQLAQRGLIRMDEILTKVVEVRKVLEEGRKVEVKRSFLTPPGTEERIMELEDKFEGHVPELKGFADLAEKAAELRFNYCNARKNAKFLKVEAKSIATMCEELITLKEKTFDIVADVTKIKKRNAAVETKVLS